MGGGGVIGGGRGGARSVRGKGKYVFDAVTAVHAVNGYWCLCRAVVVGGGRVVWAVERASVSPMLIQQ